MNKIKTALFTARKFITKNSPTILTVMGSAGLVGTVVHAVTATPKAIMLLDERLNDTHDTWHTQDIILATKEDLNAWQVVQTCWKPFVPTLIIGGASIACIVGANSINLKRQAALVGMYTMANKNLEEYEKKVREILGDKNADKVRDVLNQDAVAGMKEGDIIHTRLGETLFYEPLSGRYFKQDIERVKRAETEIKNQLLHSPIVTLNDYFQEIGLPPIAIGEEIGWCMDEIGDLIRMNMDTTITSEGQPCIVLKWDTRPSYC